MKAEKQSSSSLERDPALLRAVEAAGSWAALARALKKTRAGVWQWKRVPAERVLAVEKATGVPRHELRPDLYPKG
jgi:DNA-binding transcriptional regulator YdaS (Cro superfamily)